jgi:hypothetical protein
MRTELDILNDKIDVILKLLSNQVDFFLHTNAVEWIDSDLCRMRMAAHDEIDELNLELEELKE